MKKYTRKLKRIIAVLLCVAIIMPMMPDFRVLAQDMDTRYPYTMFASSDEEGAITINAGNICVNGDIATNGTISTTGNMNLNGKKKENTGDDMIQVLKKLDGLYFYTDYVQKCSGDYVNSDVNVNINNALDAVGMIDVDGNVNINAPIKAYKNIEISGGTLNANNVVIFSEVGDIIIDTDNVSVTGLIYAPSGDVTITGQNVNLNSVVVLAETITIDCTGLNANYGGNYARIIGKDSVEYNLDNLPDVDKDGLPDTTEKKIGTDVFNNDTDKDGLSDYQELFVTFTDYLKYDSVTSGVADSVVDMDLDGLSNIQEINIGTRPDVADTDEDGLNDGEEVEKYYTLPLNYDSDNDGLSDSDEIVLGTNPLKVDTDNDGVLDGAETFRQTVDKSRFESALFEDNFAMPQIITVSAKGNVNSTLEVTEYTGCLKGDDRNYVGKAIEVKGNEIVDGEITFVLSDTYKLESYVLAGRNTNGLVICHNNGEDTTPLKTVYDKDERRLSADIVSEGIYFVVNVIELAQSLGVNPFDEQYIKSSEISTYSLRSMSNEVLAMSADSTTATIGNVKVNGQADIVFVVDTTGSMNEEIANVKANITAFVEEIENAGITSNFALVEYKDTVLDSTDTTRIIRNSNSNWFSNSTGVKKVLAQLELSGGGGDGPESAVDALGLAKQLDMRSSAQKFFILVTDDIYKIDNRYGISSMGELVKQLNESAICVSVVAGTAHAGVYKDLYAGTGGVFADVNTDFKKELLKIANVIKEDTNDGYWVAVNGLTPNYIKLNEAPVADSTSDTDGDTLTDIEELSVVKDFFLDKFFNALDVGRDLFLSIPKKSIFNFQSNPALKDSDNDGITDDEEFIIGTNVILADSDNDKLTDGQEVALWYDPMNADPDYDRRKDNVEYNAGTSPYTYDKIWIDHKVDFLRGVVLGDFIRETDSVAVVMGQVVGSCIPGIDLRDVIANLANGDYLFAGLSAVSLIPAAGDALKAAGKVGTFIFKNIDTPSDVAIVVKFINENFPDVAKKLKKIDNIDDVAKAISKLDNIKLTKSQMKALMKGFDEAGLGKYLIKTSDLPHKDPVKVSEEIWNKWPFFRGQDIDEIVNEHSKGIGLGKTFPVVDRVTEDGHLVSTKSLDIGSQCYQSSGRLEKVLNGYLSDLVGFEVYFFQGKPSRTWGGRELKKKDYKTKVLEIVLPDSIINQKNLTVLKDFIETAKASKIEVWYRIGS